DVLANVANMALTNQSLRRAPGWVNFVYLLFMGLLISYFVTHWNTTWSALATAGAIAGSGALFWGLFTGPAILVAGAGPIVTAVLTFAGVTAYKELITQRSKRKLQRELEKNTSPELVKIILERPEVLSEPRRTTGTFFFSDVKSFTSISEKMHADVLFPFINRYLDRQTQALKAHQAFVDKYIGDGIMALFGIPVPTPDHARNACLAALDCQAALKPLNAEFKLEGLPQIKARIGIHSGEVSAGNVGALDRSNYTVLGDNVNLAARLEGANKEYDTSVMISEATWALVQGKVVVRELDRIRVVGKKNAVRIYELIAAAGMELPVSQEFLDVYAAALAAFKERRWAEAIQGFQKAQELKAGDTPSKTYVERAKVFQIMPPPADWEAVFDLTSK
ncbi:MAG TPA: adenylate/guanylate cyclase domain-containing protein, partial [Planctomycetota bacterium]|nr:adenylate/guanylate cyclase domain-containing protein [Planctomycetota bacterium]